MLPNPGRGPGVGRVPRQPVRQFRANAARRRQPRTSVRTTTLRDEGAAPAATERNDLEMLEPHAAVNGGAGLSGWWFVSVLRALQVADER